jgi:uncharacterized membrane protein YeaQ/YmgE (transglycosylase-associated protein family)
MSFLTWIIVGLIAGVLASLVMGGTGYGLMATSSSGSSEPSWAAGCSADWA